MVSEVELRSEDDTWSRGNSEKLTVALFYKEKKNNKFVTN